jgi:hypothetical protein
LIDAENKAKETALEAESKKASLEKYAPVVAAKSLFHHCKTTSTPSGLTYKIVKRAGIKPVDEYFYFHYAGYFEDGNLFDSSYEDVNKAYGTFDENRAAQNGYQAFPFQAGKKDGMIRIFGRIKCMGTKWSYSFLLI